MARLASEIGNVAASDVPCGGSPFHLGDPDEARDHDEPSADPEQTTEQSRRNPDERGLAELDRGGGHEV